MARAVHHNLPLDDLFRRLELAGFEISPADRVRAFRVVSGATPDILEQPTRLRYLLAPVIVRSAAEQERFYQVFDHYWEDLQQPLETEAPAGLSPWWALLLVPVLVGIFFGLLRPVPAPPDPLQAAFRWESSREPLRPGDTLRLFNETVIRGDSAAYDSRWEWIDRATGQVEITDTLNWHTTLIIPPVRDTFFEKQVRLQVTRRPGKADPAAEESALTGAFIIHCLTPPLAENIDAPRQAPVNESIAFSVAGDSGPWTYRWDFGDDSSPASGRSVRHVFRSEGSYQVRLVITDTTADGLCRQELTHPVNVGLQRAFLQPLPLQRDQQEIVAGFTRPWRWLLAVLALGTLLLFVRYVVEIMRAMREQKPPPDPLARRFAATDRAPYFIPFQRQDDRIAIAGQELALADALRLRQAGHRSFIDVPATLEATIDRAGFPEVRYGYLSQPTDYLLLIDEQHQLSHLGHLFGHLARLLHEQDVHLEMFYYRTHFNRFWNGAHPQGLSLELLRRQYPGYRLLVLGDGHDLLDPHTSGKPSLRDAYVTQLQQWPMRLLLTPLAPVSWTYREKVLTQVFELFAADIDGLAAAAQSIEMQGMPLSPADFPAYRERQVRLRNDNDTTYQHWRRWKDYENYLSPYAPALTTWLRALAVYPSPTWEVTVAIGRALQPEGVEVTYDNLLRLARIPALQEGKFPERVRQEMLAGLHPAVAARARRAVQQELEAVKNATLQGHAARELETELAVQQFALDPDDAEARKALRYLMEHDLLLPTRERELETALRTHDRQRQAATKMSYQSSVAEDEPEVRLRDFLQQDSPPAEDEGTRLPVFNRWFWLTLLTAVLFTGALIMTNNLDGTARLQELAYRQPPSAMLLRQGLLIREFYDRDSAVALNNLAVDLYGNVDADSLVRRQLMQAIDYRRGETGPDTLSDALAYPLAAANLSRLYYNQALLPYERYLYGQGDSATLATMELLLQRAAISDSTRHLVDHARGLLNFYRGRAAEARRYYDRIDSVFFDTLSVVPNLRTLLNLERARVARITAEPTLNGLRVSVEYFVNSGSERNATLRLTATGDNSVGPVLQEIRPGQSTTDILLQYSAGRTARTDSLTVSILAENRDVLHELTVPYTHLWQPPGRSTPPLVLTGQVIDADRRRPVEQATVRLTERPTRSTDRPLQVQAYTDPRGSFTLQTPLESAGRRRFDLLVTARGYQPYARTLEEARLRNAGKMEIELNAEPDRPVQEPVQQTVVDSPVIRQQQQQQQQLPPVNPPLREVPTTATPSQISGTITDQELGQPLPGVDIVLGETLKGYSQISHTTSSGRGTFQIAVPEVSPSVRAYIFKDGYEPKDRGLVEWLTTGGSPDLRLTPWVSMPDIAGLMRNRCPDCQTCIQYSSDRGGDRQAYDTECFSGFSDRELLTFLRKMTNAKVYMEFADYSIPQRQTDPYDCVSCFVFRIGGTPVFERRADKCGTQKEMGGWLLGFRAAQAQQGKGVLCFPSRGIALERSGK